MRATLLPSGTLIFEEILPAATQVAGLLAACPGLEVLATSRAALRSRDEHELPAPPLELPDRGRPSLREAILQYAAVALFIKRATAIKPNFAITNDNALAAA
jgi:predicted ATPase